MPFPARLRTRLRPRPAPEGLLPLTTGALTPEQIDLVLRHLPADVTFVDEIPHTATGKIQKLTLRERFKDYRLPTATAAE